MHGLADIAERVIKSFEAVGPFHDGAPRFIRIGLQLVAEMMPSTNRLYNSEMDILDVNRRLPAPGRGAATRQQVAREKSEAGSF
jgi:hypothetical protein